MRNIIKIGLFTFIATIIFSCSTRKDRFLNRNYHAITSKYNILYNGKEAYKKGLQRIKDDHQDNFWKRLPIEAITFDESKVQGMEMTDFDGKRINKSGTPFDRAEEKAVKAIQKHSMNIRGYEKNSQIDDAYLLLGKSRYFTQRFIPAVEAFNYIIANYPGANLNYETRVWRAKANTRLGNEELAIESIRLLLDVLDETENVPERIIEDAHTAAAMSYAKTDTIQKTIEHLKKATRTSYNKEQTARNMFVLGQIYNELNLKDSARAVFRALADKRRAPDKYRIHANIELARSVSSGKDSVNTDELIKRFKKMIRDTDNRKYYDELSYQVGTLYEEKGDTENAMKYYKKSLKTNGSAYQKTYAFEKLGNMYFKNSDYLLAASYYDSVMKVVPKEYETEKRFRKIKRKNNGLVSLKKYEGILKNNDSILKVVSMSETDRKVYFENYIEKIKKEDEERRQQLANSQNFGSNSSRGIFGNKSRGKFYFYSMQSKQIGKSEFKRIWGTRPLEDNWRWSDKKAINSTIGNTDDELDMNQSRYNVETYLKSIPKDAEVLTKLKEERNDALYQLGLSYKEQFKNKELAIKNLERLQGINTDKELELPISYHLYQLYTETGNTEKSTVAKNFITQNYAFSKYADFINSPDKKIEVKAEEEDVVAKKYKEIYYLYKNENYQGVIDQVNAFSQTITNSNLIPKFALLKALAIGKTQSKEEYVKALNFITLSYPDTIEGKKAKEIIELLKK